MFRNFKRKKRNCKISFCINCTWNFCFLRKLLAKCINYWKKFRISFCHFPGIFCKTDFSRRTIRVSLFILLSKDLEPHLGCHRRIPLHSILHVQYWESIQRIWWMVHQEGYWPCTAGRPSILFQLCEFCLCISIPSSVMYIGQSSCVRKVIPEYDDHWTTLQDWNNPDSE